MEHSFLPRTLWTNDSKFLHHHVPDLFTSVQVTREIPAGASFGPCVLHNTFYDTIAFIALKSCDKRNKSYVFRVDPEAMRSSPLTVHWLRLVQAANNSEEQNTEAYLKGGQLYFRTIRDIKQGEELLVWYDEELSHLLGFSDIKSRALPEGFKCMKCDQAFKNENPFLAHCRFLCVQVRTDITRAGSEQGQAEVKRQHGVTDFHNIARDLEHKKPSPCEDTALSRRRKPEEPLCPRSRKTVLLEKTNITNYSNITNINTDHPSGLETTTDNLLKSDSVGGKGSAFTEVRKSTERLKQDQPSSAGDKTAPRHSMLDGQNGHLHGEADVALHSDSSAFSFVLPKRAHEEQKSAFCKPSKRTSRDPPTLSTTALCNPLELREDTSFNSKTNLGYRNVLANNLLHGDLSNTQVMPTPLTTGSSFTYTSEHWTRRIGGQLQSTSALTLLPPTFTPLGVSVQNWCAKCNLSFRMTSDLVFHMRSHHKKEFGAESQVRRKREEKLTCPICHEYFRERHHLSRHMTSHN